MLELLVHPYRSGDVDRVDHWYALLSTFPHLEWVPLSLEIADRAAQIRADHGLKTPDAVQAATALHAGATVFLTNDPAFRRVAGIHTALLDQFVRV